MSEYEKEMFESINSIQVSLARVEEKLDHSVSQNAELSIRVSALEDKASVLEANQREAVSQIITLKKENEKVSNRSWGLVVIIIGWAIKEVLQVIKIS